MAIGDSAANKILDAWFATLTSVQVALFTVAPNTATGLGGTEVTTAVDANYVRQTITVNTTNFPAASNRKKSCAIEIDFANPSATYQIVAYAVYDSSGNYLFSSPITLTANANNRLYVATGGLYVTLPLV